MSARTFHDRYGDPWRVRQVPGAGPPVARGGAGTALDETGDGCLAFEGGAGRRFFHPIPPHWTDYSDDELRALCRLALPAHPLRGPAGA